MQGRLTSTEMISVAKKANMKSSMADTSRRGPISSLDDYIDRHFQQGSTDFPYSSEQSGDDAQIDYYIKKWQWRSLEGPYRPTVTNAHTNLNSMVNPSSRRRFKPGLGKGRVALTPDILGLLGKIA